MGLHFQVRVQVLGLRLEKKVESQYERNHFRRT